MNITVFPKENSQFLLPGPAGQLEVITTYPASTPAGIGIICHPDPTQQGTMNNKVVTIVSRAFNQLNLATLRFNFRGVGKSAGEFGHTIGELEDLNAIIAWSREVLPELPLWLAGFSFGSYISAKAAQSAQPIRLISIAPPVNHYNFSKITHINCPWLVIQGDQDEVVPYESVKEWSKGINAKIKLIVMPGATHFFHGRLLELQKHIETWC